MSAPKEFDDLWEADENGCHIWKGAKGSTGYGRYRGKPAHRYAYERVNRPVPAGLELDHRCRNRACVNLDHLEAVTHWENLHRSPYTLASIGSAKTHCPAGHEYDETNTYRRRGKRYCRICLAQSSKAWKRRRHEGGTAAVC